MMALTMEEFQRGDGNRARVTLTGLSPGRQLRVRRVALGLTLWELGRRTGLAPSRLSEAERDVRLLPPEALERVEAVLAALCLEAEGES